MGQRTRTGSLSSYFRSITLVPSMLPRCVCVRQLLSFFLSVDGPTNEHYRIAMLRSLVSHRDDTVAYHVGFFLKIM